MEQEEELRSKLQKLFNIGFKQKSIANRLDLSATTLSYFLSNKRELTEKSKENIARVIEQIKIEVNNI